MESLLADADYNAPLSMAGVIIIVIVSCVLGLVWAFVNYLGVKKIDLLHGQQGEYEGLANETTEAQVKSLLDIGSKISEVAISLTLGRQGVPQAGVPGLHHFCWCDVLHHLRRCRAVRCRLHRLRLRGGRRHLHCLRSHRHDDRHLHQLQGHLLCQTRTR